jgi:hypothetical protein
MVGDKESDAKGLKTIVQIILKIWQWRFLDYNI